MLAIPVVRSSKQSTSTIPKDQMEAGEMYFEAKSIKFW